MVTFGTVRGWLGNGGREALTKSTRSSSPSCCRPPPSSRSALSARKERSNPTRLSIQLMDYGHEKPEVTAVSIDPDFSSHLYDDYLSSISDTNVSDDVFLERNKRKNGSNDDIQASLEVMDGFRVTNGLEHKISCKSSKASYILDTEDFLFRVRKGRRVSSGATAPDKAGVAKAADAVKAQRFYRFLSRP